MEHAGRVELQKYIDVDGVQYKFQYMPPSKAFDLSARLGKLVMEPITMMAPAAGDDKKLVEMLPLAVKLLKSNLHEKEIWGIILELVRYVYIDGNKMIDVDREFCGRMGHLLKVVGIAVEFQCKDFFEAVVQATAGLIEKAK
jgi:hypothetical protein